ncbi:excisionase family DNA-binding protein [Actinomadura roseirufa]|uniref:excisionase family DNA-binding protein n=1 Tax=Actinomadura roseirufa TaxID=2094049 RepID=UPI001A9544B1|nr:excisionase family DNA-binding protein [Actinomadura roseirufa]
MTRASQPAPIRLDERLLTIQEAGAFLNTGPRFPRRLVAERRIRFVKLGRFVRIPESALCEFVSAGLVEPMTASDVWRAA